MFINPLTAIDFYKTDHRRQYPDGTSMVYSNFTPRSNRLSNLPDNNDKIVFFGLQFFIKEFLLETFDRGFFNLPKELALKDYKRRMDTSLGPDTISTDHLAALHDLGYLPLEIRALPEGSLVNMKIPCLTVHNTHPDFFWLVNYIETVMSAYLWKASVSATTSRWYRQLFNRFAEETGADPSFCQFQGHDFSFRGMSGVQDAALSGAAHLTSFVGTDTVPAIDLLENYYEANAEQELIGCSVPATEHSVMCMGTKESEIDTFKRLITELYPSGIVSIVSDTWDFWKVVSEYTKELKDVIMNRDGKVVIRPDSGNPADIICGKLIEIHKIEADTKEDFLKQAESYMHDRLSYETGHGEYGGDLTCDIEWDGQIYNLTYSPDWNRYDKQYYYMDNYGDKTPYINSVRSIETSIEERGAIEVLWEIFGGRINEMGYKELDPHIGLIYGDSITPRLAQEILQRLKDKGFASTNVVLGIGSFTYQYVTRDTYGFAVKASYGEVNGEGRAIFKDPVTDEGTKKSAKGLLLVHSDENGYTLEDNVSKEVWETSQDEMRVVFKNGSILISDSLHDIRNRVK